MMVFLAHAATFVRVTPRRSARRFSRRHARAAVALLLAEPERRRSTRALAWDLETTGLDTSTAEIVQLSIVCVNSARETPPVFTRLVMPKHDVPAEAAAVHGWTRDRLADEGAEDFATCGPRRSSGSTTASRARRRSCGGAQRPQLRPADPAAPHRRGGAAAAARRAVGRHAPLCAARDPAEAVRPGPVHARPALPRRHRRIARRRTRRRGRHARPRPRVALARREGRRRAAQVPELPAARGVPAAGASAVGGGGTAGDDAAPERRRKRRAAPRSAWRSTTMRRSTRSRAWAR